MQQLGIAHPFNKHLDLEVSRAMQPQLDILNLDFDTLHATPEEHIFPRLTIPHDNTIALPFEV